MYHHLQATALLLNIFTRYLSTHLLQRKAGSNPGGALGDLQMAEVTGIIDCIVFMGPRGLNPKYLYLCFKTDSYLKPAVRLPSSVLIQRFSLLQLSRYLQVVVGCRLPQTPTMSTVLRWAKRSSRRKSFPKIPATTPR